MRAGLLIFVGGLLPGLAAGQGPASELAFFESKIRPVLIKHCYECHSSEADGLKGGLRLDSREGLLRGGDSGPAVVPGDSGEGTLISALRHESFEMPPAGQLPESTIDDFIRWIERGAVDPRDEAVSAAVPADAPSADFWAFEPLRRPDVPAVTDTVWPRTPIDYFLLAARERAGLSSAADASRETLIRRLYFDLIGLPPSAAEREQFLTDRDPAAVERLVDRLLASPHFGERWGRHWLDVARFAESTGGGRTRILFNAWRYRDYVLDAWNDDKPYDQFVREQLAGDLLSWATREQRVDQLTATGFLVLGPINYELQDKTLLQMEIVDEQLDTLGRAFLGMTIGCARCHDHKFDPISTRDYYALAGIFRSTKTVEHANVSNFIERPLPLPAGQQQKWERYQAQLADYQQRLAALQRRRGELGGAVADTVAVDSLPGIVIDDTQAELSGSWKASSSVKPFVGTSYRYTGGASAGDATARFAASLPQAGIYRVRLAYTAHANRADNTLVRIEHAGGTTDVRVNQRKRPADHSLFVTLGEFAFVQQQPAVVTIHSRQATGNVIADAVQFLAADAASNEVGEEAQQTRELERLDEESRHLEAELAELQKNRPASPAVVLSVYDQEQIEDCPLHVRGNVRQLQAAVPRGVLTVAGASSPPAFTRQESGRRELAEWIVDPRNPLTARVLVNRLWHHLMGSGLVRTTDNFGRTGEPASHPELLDYLACELISRGWSAKRVIREIVLSRTYQLSATPPAEAARIDPDNRLLGYRARRRLDAEAIRDAILTVSGRLDAQMHGSLIAADLSSEFGYSFGGTRRSIYVPVFRNTLDGLLEVFDFANPNLVHGRRDVSTLPTQALYLMNSPFVRQHAEAAADRLLEAGEPTLDRAYLCALGRLPTPRERARITEYLSQFDADPAACREAWCHVFQTLFACLDFRYVQ